MKSKRLPRRVFRRSAWWTWGLAGLVLAGPAAGQVPGNDGAANQKEPAQTTFERVYIDPSAYRSPHVLLYDWPALTALVRWARPLETAVAEDDQTLTTELLAGFRARADSLAAAPLPAFLAGRRDSVRTALNALGSYLDRAEAALAAAPVAVTPTDGVASAEAARQRTLITGSTAVTVPAGVTVGARDTLPTASLPGQPENPLDLIVRALGELDRVVHLTRTAGPGDVSDPPTPR